LTAQGNAKFTMIASSAGVSGGSAGAGIGATTLVHTDNVEAYIGDGAVIAAKGAQGLSLTATSTEDMLAIAGALGIGSSVGVAGSATINILNEHTHAYIADGAKVNQINSGAALTQSVRLKAEDTTTILDV